MKSNFSVVSTGNPAFPLGGMVHVSERWKDGNGLDDERLKEGCASRIYISRGRMPA